MGYAIAAKPDVAYAPQWATSDQATGERGNSHNLALTTRLFSWSLFSLILYSVNESDEKFHLG